VDSLLRDAAGNIYGTTFDGGTAGVVFKLVPSRTETVLHNFAGNCYGSSCTNPNSAPDGANPIAGVIRDPQGNLYGTTSLGGVNYVGTVFKLDSTGQETFLYSFGDGYPDGGVIRDSAGNLYGATTDGGIGYGAVFKLDTSGKESNLYSFIGGPYGYFPFSALIQDPNGNFYGTTYAGGDMSACEGVGCGVVFKVDPSGNETVLYSFTGGTDGSETMAGLVRDKEGNLYGTTYEGGRFGAGAVFKLDTAGNETTLHSFAGGTDGAHPNGGLTLDSDGGLYGMTVLGGVNQACPSAEGCGTVFRINNRGRETVLHRFKGYSDGAYPQAGLVLDGRDLYGATYAGGTFDAGVIFKLTLRGKCDDDEESGEEQSPSIITQAGATSDMR